MHKPRLTVLLAVILAAGVLAPATVSAEPPPRDEVDIQFLTISDWHGQLDPVFVFGSGNFGGAAELATYFQMEEAANPNTLIFTAGDATGASPPLSNFFDDEPAVRAMRLMGVDADTLGNHNFDRGIDGLQPLLDIANDTTTELGDPIAYVSTNLKNRDDELTGVSDYAMFDVGGVQVAVIGLTNPEAPELTFPGSFGTIEITDPIPAANKARVAAKKEGAQVFVLLTHMGITGVDDDGNAFGPLIDLAENVGGFDVIVGDHTDFEFSAEINNALVVENRSRGVSYAKIEMTVDAKNGRIVSESVSFVEAASDAVTPDQAIVDLLAPLRIELDLLLAQVVGQSDVVIPRTDSCGNTAGRSCESLVGNVVTDAMRARYNTDFAITNAGGLRADMTCPTLDSPTDFCPPFVGPNYDITAGSILTVLPFANEVVTVEVTGAELKAQLENGVSRMPAINGRFAQVSGLCFTYDIDAAVGDRVTSVVYQNADGSCSIDVVDLSDTAMYSLAQNDFMAVGGDGYLDLSSRMVTQELMDQVVTEVIAIGGLISPVLNGRITCTASAGGTCPVALP